MFKLLNTSVSVRIEDELNDIETSHSAFWVNIVSKYTSITIRSKYTSFEIEVYFDRSILLLVPTAEDQFFFPKQCVVRDK